MFKTFAVHGNVPAFLLVCTLIPLVKDPLGDLASSDNYRAIAISALLLKLFDLVVLQLEGNKLLCDEMQFGFQPKSSTSMCSWAVTTVIDYYNRAGTTVYGCTMDLSKAFDMVEWCTLFNQLRERGVSPVFLRVILVNYSDQYCDVRWNGAFSCRFSIRNGVRQGAISSAIFFTIYVDKLITEMRKTRLGCTIGGHYFGIMIYCDDIFLLSASRAGLQAMVTVCEKFANKFHLKFSTNDDPTKSKTKCIIFCKNSLAQKGVLPIKLNGKLLPFCPLVKHLGCYLQGNNSMTNDCDIKRGQFIGKIHSLSQEFYFVTPSVLVKFYNIYTTAFFGSNLYDLFGKSTDQHDPLLLD